MAQNPTFVITMEDGREMKGELYPEIAPQSVGTFIALANSGFYDGLIFHRVIPGFMIQGGDPKGVGIGGPGYHIKGEFAMNGWKNDLKHTYGVLSMARSMMPDSAGSQFFIMTSNSPHLDGQYAAFGKVLEGMDVAEDIVNTKRDMRDKPVVDQRMKSIRVETFGEVYPFDQMYYQDFAPKVSKGRSESPLVASADAKSPASSYVKEKTPWLNCFVSSPRTTLPLPCLPLKRALSSPWTASPSPR